MDLKNNCNEKVISGIRCDVVNCTYHKADNCCAAGSIQVGHGPCNSCSDTACETFKPKN